MTIHCQQFRDALFQWIDGELDGDAGRAAAGHEAACADCAGQAEAERAFEARTRVALASGTPAIDVAAILRDAPSAETRPERPAGRLLRLRKVISSVAGIAAVFLGLAWFNCVPPFECSYLQAVERAAFEEPGAPLPDEMPAECYEACVETPSEVLGFVLAGDAEGVRVGYGRDAPGVRARYDAPSGTAVVVWCEQVGERPSFRRREDRGGVEWWIAEENGRTLVSYMCAVTDSFVTVAGNLPETDLLALATELRQASHE